MALPFEINRPDFFQRFRELLELHKTTPELIIEPVVRPTVSISDLGSSGPIYDEFQTGVITNPTANQILLSSPITLEAGIFDIAWNVQPESGMDGYVRIDHMNAAAQLLKTLYVSSMAEPVLSAYTVKIALRMGKGEKINIVNVAVSFGDVICSLLTSGFAR